MGREVRRVPADWEHPMSEQHPDRHQPQYDQDFASACDEWKKGFAAWEVLPEQENCEFWEWNGDPPDRAYYREAVWTDEERTHYQMYETTSEGTPISPVMESPEELARWLVDNDASAFAGEAASYEAWLRLCNGGYACSAVISADGLQSGVEGFTTKEAQEPRHDAE